MQADEIVIGGASGFWGDANHATSQLLAAARLDYIVYDYLAEITMSILARARAKQASAGFALDFVTSAMAPNLAAIESRGVKIISNAGGVNPQACAAALQTAIDEQGLGLKVACVVGDDILPRGQQLFADQYREMFSGEGFPDPATILSINAYLGAFPIAQALALGADIIITGRCVDSAVTLGACIHAFDWQPHQLELLAMGSLAGHILECGQQATGGNFTDWQLCAESIETIGFPLVEMSDDGSFVCTKPEDTGGLVSIGTIAEQMLYEIGDPQQYVLPDVVCDFSAVKLQQQGPNRVRVSGAHGRAAPTHYKVCVTYADEFRGGTTMTFYGIDAERKASALGAAIFRAARRVFKHQQLPDFSETSIELIGAESQFGDFRQSGPAREVALKIAAKHPLALGIGIMLREAVGLGLATPPGLCGFQGARPKPSPVVRLFSFALEKHSVPLWIEFNGQQVAVNLDSTTDSSTAPVMRPLVPELASVAAETTEVPLIRLAWGRSGDKGDNANIGIIARNAEYFPFIIAALTVTEVEQRFAHFLAADDTAAAHSGAKPRVERFILPGIFAINFLLHRVLGGGGMASIRSDPQGKGFAQLLLEVPVRVPTTILTQG